MLKGETKSTGGSNLGDDDKELDSFLIGVALCSDLFYAPKEEGEGKKKKPSKAKPLGVVLIEPSI
ncbi:hypothetical protein TorRG33x02_014850 [Trema orientale]|uniref:Uncharacterized protein n=1 Tax=Trema orientale TaxID=63057 RepID=A0A2P5FXH3_TREOI|nr:hypothetical protein TorRG33x02_014850 [Trema orientale]